MSLVSKWAFGFSSIIITTCLCIYVYAKVKNRKKEFSRLRQGLRSQYITCQNNSYIELIGNTPMLKLKKLSTLLDCTFLVKMESMNPSGTGKDRAAKWMLQEVLMSPSFRPGIDIIEGTSGSTGIALASICNAMGLNLHIVMPDDQAAEKRILLERLGASVTVVPCCGISNMDHYVNAARKLAIEMNGIFMDQFENRANFEAHFRETGPEIWEQSGREIDAFVMSAGTGGTIAGVSRYLKARKPSVGVYLADPDGSSLLHRVKFGVCFTHQQKERKIKKHRYDSIVEGVGLDRVTKNFMEAIIDDGEKVCDQDVIDMAHWLLREEGLFVGSSSALNIAAACSVARKLGSGKTIVTIVCDSGHRHLSRFWNPEYIATAANSGIYSLKWPSADVVPTSLAGL